MKQNINRTGATRAIAAAIGITAAAGVASAAFYQGLTVRRYRVFSRKVRTEKGIRLVHLSDLHSHIYGSAQETLLAKIRRQRPDLVLMTGDIVDDNNPVEGARLLLEGLREIAPAYYVSGNHEYRTGRIEEVKDLIRSYGVTVLERDVVPVSVRGNRLCVCGIDDPEWLDCVPGGFPGAMGAFGGLPEDAFNILLSHRPERVADYARYSFDMVLSGHAHGGQVRVPFLLNGLFAPNQGLFPKYAGGRYRHAGMTHIVSRGLSYNPLLPRIFNPPEVVVIDLMRVVRP